MLELIKQPWPWYVVGPILSVILFLTLWLGKTFAVSSTFGTICTVAGAGKYADFFNWDWKTQIWNLIFVFGGLVGGYIASHFLANDQAINLSANTIYDLQQLGIIDPGADYVPLSIFSWEGLLTLKGFILMVVGGFLVGFGSRYAGGCTSGHAITGLSNLQLPSLIAVIGFFIGGMFVTYLILPYIFKL